MSGDAVIGLVAGIVAIFGALLAHAKFAVRAPLESQAARLEAEKASVDAARADVERKLAQERERAASVDAKYKTLQQDFINFRSGQTGIPLKMEIESGLSEALEVLEVSESSILIPGPPSNSSRFVFLSITGPAARKLRWAKLELDKGIVGQVFATGVPHNTANASNDPHFFSGIDEKADHETKAMLTVPLKHRGGPIGVAQFLNKAGGFTPADEVNAEQFAALLAPKVAAFARNPENFELLGLAWRSEDREATIAFCDLTSSSLLLEQMNVPSAIDCINEYLEQQCDIAMNYGATVDKYLGDGVMLRFNVPRRIVKDDHWTLAVEAALDMRRSFEHLKDGWVNAGLPVDGIYGRIGLSCGIVHEARIGHPQFQQLTVVGEPVNDAANLCENASRAHNVILIPAGLVERLDGRFLVSNVDSVAQQPHAYEVLKRAE